MANFTAGTSFSDGVTNDVTAAKLNALVADAVPTSNLSLNSTTGTIATFNSTTGTIPTLVATTLITTGTGTAAAPAIVPTGDTNTGIFFPAADTIAFSEGGAEAMRINSSGRVGIGTASPTHNLTLENADTNPYISFNTAGVLKWLVGKEGTQSERFVIASTSAYRMVIDSSGNVGIGTGSTGITSRLDITGTSAATQSALIYASGSNPVQLGLENGYGARQGVVFSNTGSAGHTSFGIISENTALTIKTAAYNIGTTSDLNTSWTERLRIDSSGGVTIAGLAGSGSRAVNASAAGLLSAASDASLKEEVVGAHIAGLDEILQIHPKMYRWKDDIANRGDEASVELGFIANDVAPIIPSAAPMGNDGLYGFYDRSITAALVKAVQELSAKVTALEAA
jgi:hypothetical protein